MKFGFDKNDRFEFIMRCVRCSTDKQSKELHSAGFAHVTFVLSIKPPRHANVHQPATL